MQLFMFQRRGSIWKHGSNYGSAAPNYRLSVQTLPGYDLPPLLAAWSSSWGLDYSAAYLILGGWLYSMTRRAIESWFVSAWTDTTKSVSS